MFCDRFARRVSLKVVANHGWFVAVLHVGCRSKGAQTMDGRALTGTIRLKGINPSARGCLKKVFLVAKQTPRKVLLKGLGGGACSKAS